VDLYRLSPETIKKATGLGAVDIAIGRFSPVLDVDNIQLYLIWVNENEAHVAYHEGADLVPLNTKYEEIDWSYLGSLGPAIDVAVEWDGYWEKPVGSQGIWSTRASDATRWIKISSGDPWLFWVTPTGDLKARQGFSGSDKTLASGGVDQVSAVRAWKNVRTAHTDQGLVAFYLRGGEVFYRNLAEQENGDVIWETEYPDYSGEDPDPPLFDTGHDIEHLRVFKTNDYRFGIIVTDASGESYWKITRRRWAGMAIDEAKVSADLSSLMVDFIELHYQQGYEDEYIDVSLSALSLDYLWADDIPMLEAENFMIIDEELEENWGRRIRLTFSHPVENRSGNQAAFIVTDSNMETYSVSATEAGDTPYEVVLLTADFNEAQGLDLTVDYDNTGSLAGGEGTIGQSLGVSSITFTPTDLTGITAEPPVPELIWNE